MVPLSVSFLLPFLGWAFPGVLRGGFVCSICVFIPPLGCIARVVGFFVSGCVVCLFFVMFFLVFHFVCFELRSFAFYVFFFGSFPSCMFSVLISGGVFAFGCIAAFAPGFASGCVLFVGCFVFLWRISFLSL